MSICEVFRMMDIDTPEKRRKLLFGYYDNQNHSAINTIITQNTSNEELQGNRGEQYAKLEGIIE